MFILTRILCSTIEYHCMNMLLYKLIRGKHLHLQLSQPMSGLAHFREKLVLDRAEGTTWDLPGNVWE